jgi:hypothetical protein
VVTGSKPVRGFTLGGARRQSLKWRWLLRLSDSSFSENTLHEHAALQSYMEIKLSRWTTLSKFKNLDPATMLVGAASDARAPSKDTNRCRLPQMLQYPPHQSPEPPKAEHSVI